MGKLMLDHLGLLLKLLMQNRASHRPEAVPCNFRPRVIAQPPERGIDRSVTHRSLTRKGQTNLRIHAQRQCLLLTEIAVRKPPTSSPDSIGFPRTELTPDNKKPAPALGWTRVLGLLGST